MKKTIFFTVLVFCSFIFKGQAKYYLTNQAGEPYGTQSNINVMNSTFGPGNWTQVLFQTVNPATLFSPTTCLIFTDGSSQNASELNTFLTTNITALENWVNAGGRFVLNAAPNEGANINLGFG